MDGTGSIDDTLAHFGIKGMKWGHRKNPEQRAAQKIQKEDRKFEKQALNPHTAVALWGHSVGTFKKSGDLKAINNKPEYAASKWRLKFGVAKRELQKKYDDEVAGKFLQHLKKNANEIVNRSGTRQFDIELAHKKAKVIRASTAHWTITTRDIQQSADGDLVIRIVRDEVGRIIDMIPENDMIEQSEEADKILAHFGIKGMKWGVKKAPRPVSADARQKQAIKEKVKANKIASVSNKDLQTAINRMRLEQDFKRLKVNEQNGFTRWASSALLEIGKREVQVAAGKAIAGAIAKKAATGGVA